MSAHTPGPWEIVEPFGNGEYVKVIGGIDGDAHDDGTPYMTSTHVCDVIDNQDEWANARLIAAAPDLLALAKQYASECSGCDGKGKRALGLSGYKEECEDCADIRAVIAKAEGRT